MAIVQISKIQQRSGNLVDLPQLDEAELGYATDHHRLFIGNKPITFKGDGVTRRFSIREADIIPNQTRVMVNSIDAYFDPALVSTDDHQTEQEVGGEDIVHHELKEKEHSHHEEGKSHETNASTDTTESTSEENKKECPVCRYMKGGPCKDDFTTWVCTEIKVWITATFTKRLDLLLGSHTVYNTTFTRLRFVQ